MVAAGDGPGEIRNGLPPSEPPSGDMGVVGPTTVEGVDNVPDDTPTNPGRDAGQPGFLGRFGAWLSSLGAMAFPRLFNTRPITPVYSFYTTLRFEGSPYENMPSMRTIMTAHPVVALKDLLKRWGGADGENFAGMLAEPSYEFYDDDGYWDGSAVDANSHWSGVGLSISPANFGPPTIIITFIEEKRDRAYVFDSPYKINKASFYGVADGRKMVWRVSNTDPDIDERATFNKFLPALQSVFADDVTHTYEDTSSGAGGTGSPAQGSIQGAPEEITVADEAYVADEAADEGTDETAEYVAGYEDESTFEISGFAYFGEFAFDPLPVF